MSYIKNLTNSMTKKVIPNVLSGVFPDQVNAIKDVSANITSSKEKVLDSIKGNYNLYNKDFEGFARTSRKISQQIRSGKFGLTEEEMSDIELGDMMPDFMSDGFDESSGSDDIFGDDSNSPGSRGAVKGIKNFRHRTLARAKAKVDAYNKPTYGDTIISDKLSYLSLILAEVGNRLIDGVNHVTASVNGIGSFLSETTAAYYKLVEDKYEIENTYTSTLIDVLNLMKEDLEYSKEKRVEAESANMFKTSNYSIAGMLDTNKLASHTDMLDTLLGPLGLNGEFKKAMADPLGYGLGMLLAKGFKTIFANQIQEIQTFTDTLGSRLQTMFEKWSDSASGPGSSAWDKFKGFLGDTFKLNRTTSAYAKIGKYENAEVSYDLESKRAVTNVIPMFLSKILSVLSSGPYQVYDKDAGRFVNASTQAKKVVSDLSDIRHGKNLGGLTSVTNDLSLGMSDSYANRIQAQLRMAAKRKDSHTVDPTKLKFRDPAIQAAFDKYISDATPAKINSIKKAFYSHVTSTNADIEKALHEIRGTSDEQSLILTNSKVRLNQRRDYNNNTRTKVDLDKPNNGPRNPTKVDINKPNSPNGNPPKADSDPKPNNGPRNPIQSGSSDSGSPKADSSTNSNDNGIDDTTTIRRLNLNNMNMTSVSDIITRYIIEPFKEKILDPFLEKFSKVMNSIGNFVYTKIYEPVKKAFNNATNYINRYFFGNEKAAKKGLFGNIGDKIKEVYNKFDAKILTPFKNSIKNLFGPTLKSFASELGTTLKSFTGGYGKSIKEYTKEALKVVMESSFMKTITKYVVDPLKEAVTKLGGIFNKAFKWMINAPANLLRGATNSMKLRNIKKGVGNYSEEEKARILNLEKEGKIWNFKDTTASDNIAKKVKEAKEKIKTKAEAAKDSVSSKVSNAVVSSNKVISKIEVIRKDDTDVKATNKTEKVKKNLPDVVNNTNDTSNTSANKVSNPIISRNDSTLVNSSQNKSNNLMDVTPNKGNINETANKVTNPIVNNNGKGTNKEKSSKTMIDIIAANTVSILSFLRGNLVHVGQNTESILKYLRKEFAGKTLDAGPKKYSFFKNPVLWLDQKVKGLFNIIGSTSTFLMKTFIKSIRIAKDMVSNLVDSALNITKNIGKILTRGAKLVLTNIGTITSKVATAIGKATIKLVDIGIDVAKSLADLTVSITKGLINTATAMVKFTSDFISRVAKPLADFGVKFIEMGAKHLLPVLDTMTSALARATKGLIDFTMYLGKLAVNGIKNILNAAGRALGGVFNIKAKAKGDVTGKMNITNFAELNAMLRAAPLKVFVTDGKIATYQVKGRVGTRFIDNEETRDWLKSKHNSDKDKSKEDESSNGPLDWLKTLLPAALTGGGPKAIAGKALGGVAGAVAGTMLAKKAATALGGAKEKVLGKAVEKARPNGGFYGPMPAQTTREKLKDGFKSKVKGMSSAVKENTSKRLTEFKEWKPVKTITTAKDGVTSRVSSAASKGTTAVKNAGSSIKDKAINIATSAKDGIKSTVRRVIPKATTSAAEKGIGARFGGAVGNFAKGGVGQFLGKAGKGLGVAGLISMGGGLAADTFFDKGTAGHSIMSKGSNDAAIGAMVGSIIPGLGTALGAVIGGVVGTVRGYIPFFVEKYKNELLDLTNYFQEIPDRVSAFAASLPDRIDSFLANIPDYVASLFKPDVQGITDAIGDNGKEPSNPGILTRLFVGVGNALWAVIKNLPSIALSIVTGLGKAMVTIAGSMTVALGGAVRSVVNSVTSYVAQWPQRIANWVALKTPNVLGGISQEEYDNRTKTLDVARDKAIAEKAAENAEMIKTATDGVKNASASLGGGKSLAAIDTSKAKYEHALWNAVGKHSKDGKVSEKDYIEAYMQSKDAKSKDKDTAMKDAKQSYINVQRENQRKAEVAKGTVNAPKGSLADTSAKTATVMSANTGQAGNPYNTGVTPKAIAPWSPPVMDAITKMSNTYGIPFDVLRAIAKIESNGNPEANRGNSSQYKGLFQMGTKEFATYYVPGTPRDVFNPLSNAMAAGKYMQINAKGLKARGVPVTATTLYMAHQQGLGGATQIYNAATKGTPVSGQISRNMANNPPQDKRGSTANPSSFLSRWDNVILGYTGGKGQSLNVVDNGFTGTPGASLYEGGDADSNGSNDNVLAKMAEDFFARTSMDASVLAIGRYTGAKASSEVPVMDTAVKNPVVTKDGKETPNTAKVTKEISKDKSIAPVKVVPTGSTSVPVIDNSSTTATTNDSNTTSNKAIISKTSIINNASSSTNIVKQAANAKIAKAPTKDNTVVDLLTTTNELLNSIAGNTSHLSDVSKNIQNINTVNTQNVNHATTNKQTKTETQEKETINSRPKRNFLNDAQNFFTGGNLLLPSEDATKIASYNF